MAENLSESEVDKLPVESIVAQVLDKCICCNEVDARSLVVVKNGIHSRTQIMYESNPSLHFRSQFIAISTSRNHVMNFSVKILFLC